MRLLAYLSKNHIKPGIKTRSNSQVKSTNCHARNMSDDVDEIGSDIQRLKDMGVDHIVFAYNFLPTGSNVNEMFDTSKQLSKFAR